MSSTTVPQTFLELATSLINDVRQNTDNTLTMTLAKRSINTALHDMHTGTGERFPWAIKQATLVTHPTYSTGSLDTTQGGTVSLVGGNFDALNAFLQPNGRAGGKLIIDGAVTTYGVQSIFGLGQGASLTPFYLGQTATGVPFVYFEDEYDLEVDFLRPYDLRKFSNDRELPLIGQRDFEVRYPRNNVPSEHPRVGTIVTRNFGTGADRQRLRVAPPSSTAIAIPYSYITSNLARTFAGVRQTYLIADTDEPIVPSPLRRAIVLHALANWYRDRKDDAREQSARNDYVELVNRIMGDQGIGSQKPSFRPVMTHYRRRSRRPWSGSPSRFDVNGRFDRLEDL